MSPLRILHVLNRLGAGGTEFATLRLIRGLDPSLFQQTICSIHAPAPQLERAAQTITLNRISGKRATLIPKMVRAIREQRPHIVHARNWGAIEAVIAAKIAGVPAIIYSEHGRNLETAMSIPRRQRWMRAAVFRIANEVFSVSNELKHFYTAQVGSAALKVKVIENGVDTLRFAPSAAARASVRQRLAIANSELVVGAVGRLDPVKDCPTLLRAAEVLSRRGIRFRLLLIGEGPERRKLEAIIESSSDLRENAHLVGEVTDIEKWFNALDVVVLSSLSEGMSNTLLEAMATSLPTVATAVGSAPEIVEHNTTGFLFRPGDIEDLAARLQILFESKALRVQMGAHARERIVQRYSLERMLADYQELYLGSLRLTRAGRRTLADVILQRNNESLIAHGVNS